MRKPGYQWTEFIRWICEHSCATCGFGGVEHPDGNYYNSPSHIKTRGSGGKDEGNVIPQCFKCHTELGKIGVKTFGTKYKLDLHRLAEKYGHAYNTCNVYDLT